MLKEDLIRSVKYCTEMRTKYNGSADELRPFLPEYLGRPVKNREELWDIVVEKLHSGTPFFCGRLGGSECQVVGEYLEKQCGIRVNYDDNIVDWMRRTSGFFFADSKDVGEELDRYALLTIDAVKQVDIFLSLFWKYFDIAAKYYATDAILTTDAIWPYRNIKWGGSWTAALEGKKVLVVSPFSESIKYQYSRKEKLAKYPEFLLPDFELLTYQMIETQNGNNVLKTKDWFETYEIVKNEVLAIDFDVALVGAGAYGYPLSADIKKAGRSVIETCGLTPLVFGIVGQRHIEHGFLDEFGTEAWIRPMETPPACYKDIEGGCYW